ncbi:MAG: cytochrome c [Proteobacteria bacterium]|nr:cytochrome c [Pseudomonadota bacterium]
MDLRRHVIHFVILFLGFALVSCTKKPAADLAQLSPEQLVERGRAVYGTNCIACHNTDPKQDGTVGPAIWGSSAELLKYKLVIGGYPAGYQAKRPNQVMPKFPQLEREIPALEAYLNR